MKETKAARFSMLGPRAPSTAKLPLPGAAEPAHWGSTKRERASSCTARAVIPWLLLSLHAREHGPQTLHYSINSASELGAVLKVPYTFCVLRSPSDQKCFWVNPG